MARANFSDAMVPPRQHGRSHERLKCSWSAGIISYATCRCKRLKFLTPGNMTQYRPRHHHQRFLAIFDPLLTVFLFDFWTRTLTVELSEKSRRDQRLWFCIAVFLYLLANHKLAFKEAPSHLFKTFLSFLGGGGMFCVLYLRTAPWLQPDLHFF